MASSSQRRFPVRHPVVVDVGCHCRRAKLSSLFSSARSRTATATATKALYPSTSPSSSSTTTATAAASSSWDASLSNTTATPADSPQPAAERTTRRRRRRRSARLHGSVEGESVAVVKESATPYEDFTESMVQMIVEKEMYGWDELRDLLHRLLALNSPRHHPLILRAFADVCRGVLSPPSPGR